MPALEVIEQEIMRLPRDSALELQDWLADYLDDQEELNPEFVAAIERGKQDVGNRHVRVFQPAQG
ncbi:hypothetical protein [Prosthecobacter sp.]|jgi:hypothetical protein|uniref:hypothetical protein n=1 Tax=Prosthecobacter sp. TaxID=1965333 RepID=UPI003783A995